MSIMIGEICRFQARVTFYPLVNPSNSQIMGDVESCSFDVSDYAADPSNWNQPIIPAIDGCPSAALDPYTFDSEIPVWKCV